MITEEIVDAIDTLISMCSDEQQVLGMKSVREMLCDYSEREWCDMDVSEARVWLEQYLSCKKNIMK